MARKVQKRLTDKSIDDAILSQAEEIVLHYRLIIKPHERLGYMGAALELPTVFGSGKNAAACIESTYKALTVAVASMIEAGVAPPKAASSGLRKEQMNIRLDAEEKLLLQEAASQRGFRSISDYVRAVALGDARKSA